MFARERLRPRRWSKVPHDVCAAHSHAYRKVLCCLRGSLVFRLTETGEEIAPHPGDRLDIEPGTMHGPPPAPGGVTCIEAARG
ncbi:MAG: cupin [Chloroflexota bacterium]|nr:cupin [Chloroflexota bacterium]